MIEREIGTDCVPFTRYAVLTVLLAVEKSWQNDFRGNAAKSLLTILQNYRRDSGQFYARYVNIIQSSGTGKSRMTDEAGKDVILIPVNLSGAKRMCVSESRFELFLMYP